MEIIYIPEAVLTYYRKANGKHYFKKGKDTIRLLENEVPKNITLKVGQQYKFKTKKNL